MTDTVFVNGTTLTDADWFNDVNRLHYTIFGDPADDAAARTGIGLGTAAVKNVGTSGDTVPVCNAANTWASAQTFTVPPVFTDATGTRAALVAAGTGVSNTFDGAQQTFRLVDNGGLGPIVGPG